AGTLSGNPLAVAAGRATLALLDEAAYARLSATTEALAAGLREAAGDRPVRIRCVRGLVTLFFTDRPVRSYADARECDTEAYRGAAPGDAGRSGPGAARRRPALRAGPRAARHGRRPGGDRRARGGHRGVCAGPGRRRSGRRRGGLATTGPRATGRTGTATGRL